MAKNSKERSQKTMWDNGRALISLRKTIKTVTDNLSRKGKAKPATDPLPITASRKSDRKSRSR